MIGSCGGIAEHFSYWYQLGEMWGGGGHLHLRPPPPCSRNDYNPGFPNLSRTAFPAALGEGSPKHHRMFRNIPGLYPLDSGNNFRLWKQKLSPDIAICPLWGEIDPRLENSKCGREPWIWNQKIRLRVSALRVPAMRSVWLHGSLPSLSLKWEQSSCLTFTITE